MGTYHIYVHTFAFDMLTQKDSNIYIYIYISVIHFSLLLTFKDEVKKLRANLKKTEKMEKSLKEQLEKISPELEKVKRLKELAEVSNVCLPLNSV